MSLRNDLIAAFGELVGTCMFLFLGLSGVKLGIVAAPTDDVGTYSLTYPAVYFISTCMGFSLLINVWAFYRVSGGQFNPAVTFGLVLIGAVSPLRALFIIPAQIAGAIGGAALAAALTPGGIGMVATTLAPGMSIVQGLFMEAFLTSMLVIVVLMLAAEKHRTTPFAPVCIGLTLFMGQLIGTLWTGCGMNPARSFAPSVVSGSFKGYHWIYWVGPFVGSIFAAAYYHILKFLHFETAVAGQDDIGLPTSDSEKPLTGSDLA